jgi:hypothetical protein
MSGSAPANFSGSLNKFHPGATRAPVAKNAQDDGIVSDESISECDEGPSPSHSSAMNPSANAMKGLLLRRYILIGFVL